MSLSKYICSYVHRIARPLKSFLHSLKYFISLGAANKIGKTVKNPSSVQTVVTVYILAQLYLVQDGLEART